jgi:hypothetical protein
MTKVVNICETKYVNPTILEYQLKTTKMAVFIGKDSVQSEIVIYNRISNGHFPTVWTSIGMC